MNSSLPVGVHLELMPFRSHAAVGVIPWATLVTLVPDPAREENPRALRSDPALREHAALRADVQRLLRGTAKGANVASYARYIARALLGELGQAWSCPPVTLWVPKPLVRVPGSGYTHVLPFPASCFAIDGETQVAAMHRLSSEAETFEIDPEKLGEVRVPVEVYWGMDTGAARQIFHDRNRYGVAVTRAHAVSMDQRDIVTAMARKLLVTTRVMVDGSPVLLKELVNTQKQRVQPNDSEWLSFLGLRTLVAGVLVGIRGPAATGVGLADLPADLSVPEATVKISVLLSQVMSRLSEQFASYSFLSVPCVLAGVGAAMHHALSWCIETPRLTADELCQLLGEVRWERNEKYWYGIASSKAGRSSFSGASLVSTGARVYNAILDPSSVAGRRIRGLGSHAPAE